MIWRGSHFVSALVALFIAPIGVYTDDISLDSCKQIMIVATVVWFGTSPFWMGNRSS
jgi:hypothetical protein